MAGHPKNDDASEILRSAIKRVTQSIEFLASAEDKDDLLGQVGFVEDEFESLAKVATKVVDESAAFLADLFDEPESFYNPLPLPPPEDHMPVMPTVEDASESRQGEVPTVVQAFAVAEPLGEIWPSDHPVRFGPYMRRQDDSSDLPECWRSETLHFYPPNRWLLVAGNVGAFRGSNGVMYKPYGQENQPFTPAQAAEWFLSWNQQVPSALWDDLPASSKVPRPAGIYRNWSNRTPHCGRG